MIAEAAKRTQVNPYLQRGVMGSMRQAHHGTYLDISDLPYLPFAVEAQRRLFQSGTFAKRESDPEEFLLRNLPPRQLIFASTQDNAERILARLKSVPIEIQPAAIACFADAVDLASVTLSFSNLVLEFAKSEGIDATQIIITTFVDPEESAVQAVVEVYVALQRSQTAPFRMAFGPLVEAWMDTKLSISNKKLFLERVALEVQPNR